MFKISNSGDDRFLFSVPFFSSVLLVSDIMGCITPPSRPRRVSTFLAPANRKHTRYIARETFLEKKTSSIPPRRMLLHENFARDTKIRTHSPPPPPPFALVNPPGLYLAGMQLVMLAGCGHVPHEERSEEFLCLALEQLSREDGEAAAPLDASGGLPDVSTE